jgi:glycosyltransferase involved in cell wall biosynthesis
MEALTLTELQDFTLNTYIKLLKHLQNNYAIVPFCDVRFEATPYLILRHDIDISLKDALTMAEIEKDLNIKSTYFVLFSSRFYNLFEGENITLLNRISDLGHEIGLHYQPQQYRFYKQDPERTLKIETQVLENFMGKKIRSIARHGMWDRDPFAATQKYVNANHPNFRRDLFVHESCRAWATIEGLYSLINNPPKRAQLLVHPENWQKEIIDREKLLERNFRNLEDENQAMKKALLEVYRTDQSVLEYDSAVKNASFKQLNYKPLHKKQSNYNKLALIRYYLLHTKIGWNLRKLRGRIQNNFTFSSSKNNLITLNNTAEKKGIENPLVSIIITSYNYSHYLADAIESVLNQTYPKIEVIIVDDGSTDETKNVVAHYSVQYTFQTHQGLAAARNNGIRLTHGEFFICLDSDDKLFPSYVEKTIKQILKNPSTGFVYTGSKVWNEITELETIWMPRRIVSKYSLFAGWVGAEGPMLTRRKAFESLSFGYDSSFPAHEDLDLCFRLLTKGWKYDVVFEPIHWYRQHGISLDPNTSPEKKKIAEAFMDRKFWFRKPYRILYSLYRNTLGRIESLMRCPIEYLRGLGKKVQIYIQIKPYYRMDLEAQEKAHQLQKEIYLAVDWKIEWHRDKKLGKYYEDKIKILEARLRNVASVFNK